MLFNRIKRLGDLSRGLLWAMIAMLLGLPLPIVALFFLCGGCGTGN